MRVNRTFTVGAAPLNVFTGAAAAPAAEGDHLIVNRVFVQMVAGGTKKGYVLDGIRPGRVPAITNDGDVTAEISAASADDPGGAYSDTDLVHGIDLAEMWVHGANAGDKIKVSYDQRV